MTRYWVAALLSLLMATTVQAERLRLVTGDDYAPFTGQRLPGQGLLTQLVRAVLAEQGLDSTLDWLPWNRGYLQTLRGDYDATFPYVRSPQREAEFLYSAPLYVAEQHLFSLAGEPIELADLAQLAGLRLCYPLGWQPAAAIQALIDQGRLLRHSPQGLSECARLLLLGRDDLFIADLRLGESALRASGAARELFHRSTEVLGVSSLHLIVPRDHPRAVQLIETFDRGLDRLRERGEYQRLIQNYLE